MLPHPRRLLTLLAPMLCLAAALRAESVPLNVYARPALNLDGPWHIIVDPYENGYYNYRREPFDAAAHPTGGFFQDRQPADKTELIEYNFDTSPTLNVPGDWNSQSEKLFYYEGTVWYRRRFDYPTPAAGRRLHLYFGAVNYAADVYLNGQKLGHHEGGFTPFAFEVTGLIKPQGNSLVVKVDNTRHADAVPTVSTDWWNYGGITRDVLLVETPAAYIRTYRVQLAAGTRERIAARVELAGAAPGQSVTLALPEARLAVSAAVDTEGVATFDLPAAGLELWSPAHPRLYRVEIASGPDRIEDRIGFRMIETKGADILLNGAPVFLRGISLHEEMPARGGRAYSREDARQLLGWARELGCNFVRLAHYPHNEFMARTADELGLLLWEEVPVYWTIQWENPATLANARAQLSDLIGRDGNRASVIVWSVANETPVTAPRTRFLKNLVDLAHTLDGSRLVSAAMEVEADPADDHHKIVRDPLGEYTDLLSFNEYIGWYAGLPNDLPAVRWSFAYNKPVFISEFGADALQGYHADSLTRYSEEYQEDLYRQTLAMLQKIPQWRGATPWILCDFRSPRRPLPRFEDGWNRKGLIGQNGLKKKAYYILQTFYAQKAAAETP